jgi:alkyl sulfatase BDS1-like metallo-beta-lactamase superfamily hydrolase
MGRDDIRQKAERYRDSIQFLWDQAVRGLNKGWTIDEIASRVVLPPVFDTDYLTSERYGVAEHHLRQICTGLRGWFDGEESRLFPVEPESRFKKLIDGFGGRAEVARQAKEAFDNNDVRWGVELATWLARSPDADSGDKQLLAEGLRLIAERTPAANIRNWAITRARHLDAQTPMDRFNGHNFSSRTMARSSVSELVHNLRVLLDPTAASGVEGHIRFSVDGICAGLKIRNCVAIPSSGDDADVEVALTRGAFESVLSGKSSWSEADVVVTGAIELADVIRCCFDHDGLRG